MRVALSYLIASVAIIEAWIIWALAKQSQRMGIRLEQERKSASFFAQKYLDQARELKPDKALEGALAQAERDLKTSHEHLKYYIEYAADLESALTLKDVELNRADPPLGDSPLWEVIRMQRDVIVGKCRALRAVEQELAAAREANRDHVLGTFPKPGPFSQTGDAYDPTAEGYETGAETVCPDTAEQNSAAQSETAEQNSAAQPGADA